MDKIKRLWRDMSLRKSIILCISAFALLAVVLSAATSSLCYHAAQKIYEAYPVIGERYYLTNENGERLGEGAYIYKGKMPLSEKDERLTSLLEFVPAAAAPIYSALCVLAAALLFYRSKLKGPLAELKAASEKISNNDLDFQLSCDSRDELGQLCNSFEIMRSALAGSFSEIWRQVEERKRLNAAFAHDLRTPLTVLKGYDEILQASGDPATRDTAATMGKHISRMESYVSSMSNLQRLEDAKPEYKYISLKPFLSSLYESADILCAQNGKTLLLQNEVSAPQLSLDSSFVSQVCNNLISNAARYARTTVTLLFAQQDNGLLLSVSDDGRGFDGSSLHKAADPYFTEETDRSEHFGLGLYICKLLCEHHGGCLKIDNISEGAKVSAFFKSPESHNLSALYSFQAPVAKRV